MPRNVGKAFGALCRIVGALSLIINKCVTRLTRIEITIARFNTWEILSLAFSENLLPLLQIKILDYEKYTFKSA